MPTTVPISQAVRRRPDETAAVRRGRGDTGAADSSLEILFGGIAIIFFVLLIVEATAYWHARNIFEESAAEGVRIAAAFDGTCDQGTAAAQALVQRRAGNWADSVQVSCALNNGVVTVSVFGVTPGVLGDSIGFTARVSESTPKER